MPAQPSAAAPAQEGTNTNHFVVADRFGDVVSYTNTIEQLGGSGIVVPGRGFLLNNELTDFNFAPLRAGVPDPNLPAAGKRPRSSMSPTIVLKHGQPFLAVGVAGRRHDHHHRAADPGQPDRLHMSLPTAIAAPRASQRNSPTTQAEPAFLALPTTPGLQSARPDVRDQRHVAAGSDDQDRADDRRRHRPRAARPRPDAGGRGDRRPPRRRRGRRGASGLDVRSGGVGGAADLLRLTQQVSTAVLSGAGLVVDGGEDARAVSVGVLERCEASGGERDVDDRLAAVGG